MADELREDGFYFALAINYAIPTCLNLRNLYVQPEKPVGRNDEECWPELHSRQRYVWNTGCIPSSGHRCPAAFWKQRAVLIACAIAAVRVSVQCSLQKSSSRDRTRGQTYPKRWWVKREEISGKKDRRGWGGSFLVSCRWILYVGFNFAGDIGSIYARIHATINYRQIQRIAVEYSGLIRVIPQTSQLHWMIQSHSVTRLQSLPLQCNYTFWDKLDHCNKQKPISVLLHVNCMKWAESCIKPSFGTLSKRTY